MVTKASEEKSKTSDSMLIVSFPGFLKCAMQIRNGEISPDEILEVKKYFNQPGLCQLFKNSDGFYIVLVTENLCYISTHPGEYKHQYSWHTIRCPRGLFIFEQDDSLIENAKLAMIDLECAIKSAKERQKQQEYVQQRMQHIVSILFGDDDDDDKDDDDYDEDDYDEDDLD